MKELIRQKKIYIAGAHSRARTLKAYINYLYPDAEILAYLVSEELKDENPGFIDEIPVIPITPDKFCQTANNAFPVYLGTRGVNHPKLAKELSAAGFSEIIPVTVDMDMELRNVYMKEWYREHGREFILIDDFCIK